MQTVKVLFVSSANRNNISPIVKSQGASLALQNISVDYFGIKGNGFGGYLSNVPRLRRHIQKTNPDIVHAHYSLSGMVAGLTVVKQPLVVSLMGSDTKAGTLQKTITQWFARYRWDKVIVKSSSMQNDLHLADSFVIPNGIDLDLFKPFDKEGLKEQFSFSSTKKTILFLADPSREVKNVALAKAAFERADQTIAEIQIRYNLTREKVAEVLNAADIVLLTSKWEGSPNVIKEAMACNKPIVATDVGDIRWLFGDEPGHFITSFDPEDVAHKINEAILFSEQKGRTNGRKRIIELGLDAVNVANRIIGVYEEVLGRK
jgi:teichuronic acid biosynthesis glycosyltransferase TuaC